MYKFTELELSLLTELKTISKIRDNEKLITRSKTIAIDASDRLQFFRRWCQGENRTHNVERIISTFNQVFDIISLETNESKRRYFVDEIRKARKGVSSIQITYRFDSHVNSQLDLLIDRVDKLVAFYTNSTFP